MNVDYILRALNEEHVDYLLIGGMNFLLRHLPELTFDVDIWVRDEAENLERLNRALQKLEAAWGPTEKEWRLVGGDWRWLQRQGCFCLTTAHGALDVFRDVRGLEGLYDQCWAAAIPSGTASGIAYRALSDAHTGVPGSPATETTENATHSDLARGHPEAERLAVTPGEIKREEERKRDAAYGPVLRWQHIQRTITWAEENLPPHLRRNRPRTRPEEPAPKK